MTASENASPRSGSGWLPKLMLWVIVIAFGYLYLSSMDQRTNDAPPSLLESLGKMSPLPIAVLPGTEPATPAPAGSQDLAEKPAVAGAAAVTPVVQSQEPASPRAAAPSLRDSHPVNQAETKAFANSLMPDGRLTRPAPVAEPERAPTPTVDRKSVV